MDLTTQAAEAVEQGRICALAARGQRDLQKLAAGYPELFSGAPFDAALFGNIAMAMAFSAPWCSLEELRVTNRAVLWGFALDWQVDYLAKSRTEIDRLTETSLAVVDGATPASDDPFARFLAELCADLAAAPAYPRLRDAWRAAVHRTLAAMAVEWEWRSARRDLTGTLPTFEEYLANADNLACTVVNVAHWIHTGDDGTHRSLPRLVEASDEVQRVLRLVNDLGTYQRDLEWGDLNAIMLVADRAEVEQRVEVLTGGCHELLAPLTEECPRQATYLARQLGFTSGFYGSTDFWGAR
ncbi:terpene synthase family protein [Micromonospora inyonensis]|uniref:Terpene synthase family, metal binding domain n=1 Tax=Micromonospora inyonensis TaxID=47866 RepID=A0A1C6S483_9ACTN|nr:terpene synthase family protein [Micromonospora inyonensis]SCL24291.1 Terpene synthase family, metal binding domain [Micromonospora inyonensis]